MASATENAVRRLEAALAGLEQAVEDRLSLAGSADGLAEEVQMLTADRARLAEALDQSEARASRLETLGRDANVRISAAIETIRALIASDEESG